MKNNTQFLSLTTCPLCIFCFTIWKKDKGVCMKLTQAFIKRAICEEGKTKQFFYDDELKGFMVEIKGVGAKLLTF